MQQFPVCGGGDEKDSERFTEPGELNKPDGEGNGCDRTTTTEVDTAQETHLLARSVESTTAARGLRVGDTLMQSNPFQGQGIAYIAPGSAGVAFRISDFVGEFSSPGLPPFTVEKMGPMKKLISYGGSVFEMEENSMAKCGTGGGIWLSSLLIVSWLLENPGWFAGKSVLELGGGAGLGGIAVSLAPFEAASVLITDHEPELIALITQNVEGNRREMSGMDGPPPLTARVTVGLLDWGLGDTDTTRYDIVIASDCVFNATAADFLTAVLQHVKPGGDLFIVNPPEPGRPGMDKLIYALGEHGDVETQTTQITMATMGDAGNSYQKKLMMVHLANFTL